MLDKLAQNKWLWAFLLLMDVGYLRSDLNQHNALWTAIDGTMFFVCFVCLLITSLKGRKKDA